MGGETLFRREAQNGSWGVDKLFQYLLLTVEQIQACYAQSRCSVKYNLHKFLPTILAEFHSRINRRIPFGTRIAADGEACVDPTSFVVTTGAIGTVFCASVRYCEHQEVTGNTSINKFSYVMSFPVPDILDVVK